MVWITIDEEINYEVSDEGQVRNKETKHVKSLRFDRYGYLRVTLYPSGKTYTVHRLVAKAFLPNPENHSQINHKDLNKTNNNSSNLEWCSVEYNNRHRSANLESKAKGENNPQSILSEEQVLYIRSEVESGKSQKDVAREHKIARQTVNKIVNRKSWKHI